MKTMKLWMVMMLTVMMGLTMTSCLKGDDGENPYDGYVIAKVVPSYMGGTPYLEDVTGNRLYPTATSIEQIKLQDPDFDLNDYALVTVFFKFAQTSVDTREAKDYYIDIVAYEGYEEASALEADNVEEIASYEKAPVVSLTPDTTSCG